MNQKTTIACIDLGSNSFRLLVTRLSSTGELIELDTYKDSIRLAGTIDDDGNIPDKVIKQCVETLKSMKEIASPYTNIYKAVATQAIRQANNYADFISAIQDATDIKVDVIDGLEEARLSQLGMSLHFKNQDEIYLSVDIGGGSTEIIASKGDKIIFMTSFKLGALALTKRFFEMGTPSGKQIRSLRNHVMMRLAPLLMESNSYSFNAGYATSGTAKALSKIDSKLNYKQTLEDIQGYILESDNLAVIEKKLAKIANPIKIKKEFGIEQKRADIILAGSIILQAISDMFSIKKWHITDNGVREGLAIDYFHRVGALNKRQSGDIRWNSIKGISSQLGCDQSYAELLSDVSARLFDTLTSILKPKLEFSYSEARELLKYSAYVNEAGKLIGFQHHHKHSYYILSNSTILGFTRAERHVLALVSRFSRKRLFKKGDFEYKPYLREYKETVAFLSSCTRLARCLTRSRIKKFISIDASLSDRGVQLDLTASGDISIDAEVGSFNKEQKILSKGLHKDIHYNICEHNP